MMNAQRTPAPPFTVLVTRPEPEAARWVDSLRALGLEALALPLIVIAPASGRSSLQQAWAEISRFKGVMCVSAAAATHFLAARPAQGAGNAAALPRFWAPGPGTARALAAAGVPARCIQSPPGDARQFDSEALWSVIQADVEAGDEVLIVRGEDAGESSICAGDAAADSAPGFEPAGNGRDWMARTLATRGATTRFVVAYRREPPCWSDAQTEAAMQASRGGIWLFSNSDAIATLLRLARKARLAPLLPAAALCTHPRIAATAKLAGFSPVRECRPTPDCIAAAAREMAAEIERP